MCSTAIEALDRWCAVVEGTQLIRETVTTVRRSSRSSITPPPHRHHEHHVGEPHVMPHEDIVRDPSGLFPSVFLLLGNS